MPIEITDAATAQAPLQVAFDYVADHTNVPDWLFGVRSFTPVGDQDYGPGSVFDASLHVGVSIKTRIQVTEWVPHRLIGLDSVSGLAVRTRWHFEPVDDRHTLVTGEVLVDLPFGPAGAAMGRLMRPALGQAVRHTTADLKQRIEAAARA